MPPNIIDVRAEMPNYEQYKDQERKADILGVAIHHSETIDRETGAPDGSAHSLFAYQVNTRGWIRGGFNYVITSDGTVQYALDDKLAAYHAGFSDPDNTLDLEYGQYWNNHYLAVCLVGWFSSHRSYQDKSGSQLIPDRFTRPSEAQFEALIDLVRQLQSKYNIPIENIRAHRELAGCSTQCPGLNLDPAQIRQLLREEGQVSPPVQPNPEPAEHVVLLPDTDTYFNAALTYIWKFQPEVSFAPQTAAGKWKYVTVVGPISNSLRAEYKRRGAVIVDHIDGTPDTVTQTLDQLVAQGLRFQSSQISTPNQTITYVVQRGDSLSKIAARFYGKAHQWKAILEANHDVLADPGKIRVGMVLKIPKSN